MTDRPLSRVSRYTARFHLPAAGLEGLVAGVFTLNDIVLRKTFGASTVIITLLVMASPVSQLLATLWGRIMEGRPKRPFILGFGVAGRIALLAVALAATPATFAVPIVVSITLATATIPALNALYQTNYTTPERGRIYGWAMSLTALCTIAASMGAGAWMDRDPGAYRIVYPVAGLLGIGAATLYYRIRTRRRAVALRLTRLARAEGRPPRRDLLALAGDWMGQVQRALRNPLGGAVATFREDPLFFRFEIAFMMYGMAFMLLQPVIPIFLVDQIRVDYSQAATARGLIFWGMISLTSPFFGRLLDRWDAVRLSAVGFALLVPGMVMMALSHTIHPVYGAFAVFGVGMGAVNIAWTMGPILFAGTRDAATYMGVHVTMVGIRGLFGNPLGLLILETLGSRAAFLCAGGLFAMATVMMIDLARRMRAGAGTRPAPARQAG